jgi:malate synthase
MVHIIRPVWEKAAAANQLGRPFPPLGYTADDADGLLGLEPAARTVRGARDLISVAVQYGNAFAQGMQAAALKPADSFGNDDVLYLMEDMATGEIRLSIVWEWLHKGGTFTEDDAETGVRAGDALTRPLFDRLLREEYAKLLAANPRDVHQPSKTTTLPIAREIVEVYVTHPAKLPWYIDLLNLNLDNGDLEEAQSRIAAYLAAFARGERLTANQSFGDATPLIS